MTTKEFFEEYQIIPLVNGLKNKEAKSGNWLDKSKLKEDEQFSGFEVVRSDSGKMTYTLHSDIENLYLDKLKKQFDITDLDIGKGKL